MTTAKRHVLLKLFPHFEKNCVILAAKLKPIIAKGWVEKVGLNWNIISKRLDSNNWVEKPIKTGVLLKTNLNIDEDAVERQFGADSLKLLPLLQQAIENPSKFDPEDGRAAETIRDCILDNGGSAVIEDGSSSIEKIGNTRHIIAIGGWTQLNLKFLSKMSPLCTYHDNSMDSVYVIRNFKLEPNGLKEMPMRAIKNKESDETFYAETYTNRFLKKDYLWITTIPLNRVISTADNKLFYTSIAGLYGAGTMAIKLFLKDFENGLNKESINQLKRHRYFQILCPVDEIDNSGDYSYPKHIDFKNSRIYPVMEPQGRLIQSDISKISDEKLELGLDGEEKPYVRINGKDIITEERFFVDLVYLAATKLKKANAWVDIKKELKWSERNIKDYPSDLRELLEKGNYKTAINRESFLERIPKRGKIRLGIFKDVLINKNLRKFKSEHLSTVEDTIDGIDLDCCKAGGQELTTETMDAIVDKQEINLVKIDDQKLKPMLRHVFVISQAVRIMGWKFHDPKWFKEWKSFLKKCLKVYELAEFDNKYQKDSEQYLRFYIDLFSHL